MTNDPASDPTTQPTSPASPTGPGPGETAMPGRRALHETAVVYLNDLYIAAAMAAHEVEGAELALQVQWIYEPWGSVDHRRDAEQPGRPAVHPPDIIQAETMRGAGMRSAHARSVHAIIGRWYVMAGLQALRAVLDGREMTADLLEEVSAPVVAGDQWRGEPWTAHDRPELPAAAELATGHADLDERVAAALTDVERAYAAVVEAERLRPAAVLAVFTGEDPPTGAAYDQATEAARRVPEALCALGRALSMAATCGDAPPEEEGAGRAEA